MCSARQYGFPDHVSLTVCPYPSSDLGEITAEPCDLGEIEWECPGCGRIVCRVGNQAIEDARFDLAEHEGRFEVRLDPVEHRQPEHAPAQDTEQRDQPDQPLGGPKACLLRPAARFLSEQAGETATPMIVLSPRPL